MTKTTKKPAIVPSVEQESKVAKITKPTAQANQFNLPDWTTPAAYDHLKSASLRVLAWEFLRRNPEYQKAWSEYANRVREIASPDADVAKYVEVMLSSNANPEDWDKLGNDEQISELHNRLHDLGFYCQLPDEPRCFVNLDANYGTPWGLDHIVNPATNDIGTVRFMDSAGVISIPVSNILKTSEFHKQAGLRDTKWLALHVDLTLPLKVIDAQLKEMVRSRREQKIQNGTIKPIEKRSVRPGKYAEYLRILDANMAGLTAPEIGKSINPNGTNHSESRQRDKRFAAALTAAQRIRDSGYRLLPMLEFKAPKSNAKNKPSGQF